MTRQRSRGPAVATSMRCLGSSKVGTHGKLWFIIISGGDQYSDATARLRKLQAMATSILKSRLMVRLPLKTWVHPGGRVALLGDACHPMLVSRLQSEEHANG